MQARERTLTEAEAKFQPFKDQENSIITDRDNH
jgi:hypothetical protein